jgi:hypothetical protein
MKIQQTSYTFDKTAKTITFTGTIPATLDKILAVVNTTANIIIYNPASTATGGTYSSPTLTLTYNTGSMNNTDKLLIYLEDGNAYNTVLSSAGENHIGAVGGNSDKLSFTITTTNGTAYTANDNMGGIVTLTSLLRVSGGTEVLEDIILWSKENQKPNLYIDFWNASPSGTYTNDAAQVIAGDDAKWLGMVEVSVSDWLDTGTISRATLRGLSILLKGSGSTSIYMTIQTKTAITYTSVSGMVVKVGVLQD